MPILCPPDHGGSGHAGKQGYPLPTAPPVPPIESDDGNTTESESSLTSTSQATSSTSEVTSRSSICSSITMTDCTVSLSYGVDTNGSTYSTATMTTACSTQTGCSTSASTITTATTSTCSAIETALCSADCYWRPPMEICTTYCNNATQSACDVTYSVLSTSIQPWTPMNEATSGLISPYVATNVIGVTSGSFIIVTADPWTSPQTMSSSNTSLTLATSTTSAASSTITASGTTQHKWSPSCYISSSTECNWAYYGLGTGQPCPTTSTLLPKTCTINADVLTYSPPSIGPSMTINPGNFDDSCLSSDVLDCTWSYTFVSTSTGCVTTSSDLPASCAAQT